MVGRKWKTWEPAVGAKALRKGDCLLGRQRRNILDTQENQERLMSSEATGIELGGGVGVPEDVCSAWL